MTGAGHCPSVSQQRYNSGPGTQESSLFERIDPRSAEPLYSQIANRVRTAIASGELTPGEGLPSVRQLAGQLRINPATVVQAYRELEQQGFVELRQGSGTYVREIPADAGRRERSREARALVRRMVSEAGRLRLTLDELRDAVAEELDLEVRP